MTELKPNPGRVAAALAALAILAAVFFAVSRSPQPSSVQAPAVPAESRLARNLDTPAAEAAAPSEGAPAAEAAAPAGDAPDSALFREAAESAEALAASLPAGSRKIAAALEAAGAAGPFPDDAEFVRGELASWKSDREADEEALRRLGLDEDAVTVRRALMLFRRLSPQGLDPLGLGVVSRWEARPEPVPGPHRPFPLKPPPGEGRAVGAADASPDGSLFLTAGARGLALYEAAGARALWRSGRPAVQAVFWDGSILAAFPDDPLVPAAIVRMSPAGAEEGRAPLPRAPFESWFEIVFAGFSRDRSGAVVILYPSAGSPEAAFLDLRSMTLREGGRLYPVGSADFKDRLSGYAYVPFDYPRLGPGLEDLSGATARLEAAWWRKFGGAAELPEKDPAGGGGRERLLHSGDGRSLLVYGPGRAASFYRIGEDGAPERAGYFSLDDLAAFDPRPMALLGAPPGRPPRALFLFTLGPGDGSYPRPYDKEREVRLCSFAAEGPECAPLPAPPPPLPAPPLPRDVGTQPLAAAAADPATGFSVLAFGNGTVMSLDILRNGLVTLKALMPVRWSAAALCPGGRLALLVDDSGAPWFLDIGQGTFAEPPPGQGGAVLASSACAGDGSALFAGLADGRILRAAPGGKPETLAAAAGIPYSMAADGSGATLWWAEDRSPGGWGPASPWNDDGEEGLLPPLRQDPARSFFWRDTGLYFGYLRRGLRELPPATRLARLDIGAAAGTGGPEAAAAPPGEETSAAPPGEEAALEGRPSAAAWAPLVWDKDLPPLELHLDPATSRPFALALRVTGVAGGPSEPDPFALAESASWDAGGADLLILDRRAAPFGALDREACRYLPGPRILCRLAFGGQDPLPGQAFSVGPEGAGAAATFSPLDAPPFASMDTPSREGGMTLAYGNAAGGAGTGIAAVSLLTGRILQEGVTGGILQEPADEGLPSEEATEGAFREEAAEGGSVAPPLPVIGGTFLEGGRKALTWSSAGSVTLWDLTGQEAEASLSVLFTRRGYEVALGPWAGEEGRRAPTEPAVP